MPKFHVTVVVELEAETMAAAGNSVQQWLDLNPKPARWTNAVMTRAELVPEVPPVEMTPLYTGQRERGRL